ncbi:hypothetical protein RNZ50_15535 [Paracoccaceae bacterium Fryx2]|nr:hypothetical protein [Paracoccaceae bacterium Fryx2]
MMPNLSTSIEADLDRVTRSIGLPPDAPLAMPKQVLEVQPRPLLRPFLLRLTGLRAAGAGN